MVCLFFWSGDGLFVCLFVCLFVWLVGQVMACLFFWSGDGLFALSADGLVISLQLRDVPSSPTEHSTLLSMKLVRWFPEMEQKNSGSF